MEWIKTSERLPGEVEPVLCLYASGMYVLYLDPFEYWHDYNGDLFGYTPSHWMPLPEPPENDNA